MVEPASPRIIHFDITAHPPDAWVNEQFRAAAPFGQAPYFFIRYRECKRGQAFTRAAAGNGIESLKTPYRATEANPIWERFLGSVRKECEPGSA